jgi:hypothetical protein
MALMGAFTIAYELQRNDVLSVVAICVVLAGIYGLIVFDEQTKLHYVFAAGVFLSILAFMSRNCYLKQNDVILLVSTLLCGRLLLDNVAGLCADSSIIYFEAAYIVNFAFFYLYLHCC